MLLHALLAAVVEEALKMTLAQAATGWCAMDPTISIYRYRGAMTEVATLEAMTEVATLDEQ